jgi:hypothetical protein
MCPKWNNLRKSSRLKKIWIRNLLKERDLAREALANYKAEFKEIYEERLSAQQYEKRYMFNESIERITELTFKLIADIEGRKIGDSFHSREKVA